MAITIKYFGAIEEATGVAEESILLEDITSLEELREYTLTKYAEIKGLSYQLALNQVLTESGSLKEGDEVAFLPPFAGG